MKEAALINKERQQISIGAKREQLFSDHPEGPEIAFVASAQDAELALCDDPKEHRELILKHERQWWEVHHHVFGEFAGPYPTYSRLFALEQ